METLHAIIAELTDLAETMRVALEAGDVAGITRAVNARAPVVARCLAAFEALTPVQRALAAPDLQAAIALDDATLAIGLNWLRETRAHLQRLRRGAAAVGRYGVAPASLPLRHAVDLPC